MKFRNIYIAVLGLISVNAFAISKLPLPAEVFQVNGRNAFVMKPEKPAAGKPWVWYAPTLKSYPHHSQQFYFEQFLKHGIAVAGYDLGEVRGAPESSAQFTVFYDAMVAKGYSAMPVLLGQSRGGLMMLCWAFRNPDKVGAFAGIYPVCNIANWPLQRSKHSVLADYGMSKEEILANLDQLNPVVNLDGLAKAGVPMFIIHGDSDRVVPYRDNSALIKTAYEKAGGEIEVKMVPGKGHAEVSEFFRDQDLLEFIFKHAKVIGGNKENGDIVVSPYPSDHRSVVATFTLANQQADTESSESWSFCSIPDFLNFDIEYPQEGWEDALGFILDSMKKENPAFAMVAGDLVMGHWGPTKKDVNKWADLYYPQWTKRWADHKLKVYTALGDHEIGDNPWRGNKAKLVPHYKDAFRRHLKMPLNGPDHMKGTAFYWTHKNALFVSVDVFESGKSDQGEIAAGVTGAQLKWFEGVLKNHRDQVDHIIVMGHTPVLRPVRTFSSSGMLTVQGPESAFWKTMVKYEVDLYLCGEVHAVTCKQQDGIQQVSHGGLLGRTDKPNYMLVTVKKDRLEVTLKEIDLINGKGRLQQQKKKLGPWDTITITDERKKQGFTPIGHVTIVKKDGKKSFESITGFFDEKNNPKK